MSEAVGPAVERLAAPPGSEGSLRPAELVFLEGVWGLLLKRGLEGLVSEEACRLPSPRILEESLPATAPLPLPQPLSMEGGFYEGSHVRWPGEHFWWES